MSLVRNFSRIFVVLAFAICALVFADAQDQTQPTPQIVTTKIRLDDGSAIIVPVSVNGSGPYDFMLDTGCAKTIVDRKLASELSLPPVGEKTVVGVLASAKLTVVHVNSVSLDGATVLGGDVFSADHATTVTSKVRGVLGEDFLRNFDVLIDYRHQVIRLESAPGLMAATAVGEHLPLQLIHNRLLIAGHIREFGDATMSALLDSGTNQVTLFKDNLGPGENQAVPIWTANFNQPVTMSAAARRIRSLNLGNNSVSDLIVIALSRQAGFDADGLIPTSLFHSIFISHAGRFVILNPSLPKNEADPTPRFAVCVLNYVGVPLHTVKSAEETARRIFDQAGVETNWMNYLLPAPGNISNPDTEASCASSLPLVRVYLVDNASFNLAKDVMGLAPKNANEVDRDKVYVFDPVVNTAVREQTFAGKPEILGHTLAHEIGHILAQLESHAPTGLMRRQWQPEDFAAMSKGRLQFNSEQAARIRNEVTRRTRELAASQSAASSH